MCCAANNCCSAFNFIPLCHMNKAFNVENGKRESTIHEFMKGMVLKAVRLLHCPHVLKTFINAKKMHPWLYLSHRFIKQ